MKKLIVFFVLINLCSNLYSQTLTGRVIGIKDGDTVVVIDSLNIQTILRLADVDCPEKSQPFGTKSKQFTSDQIYQKTIKYNVSNIDRYGRSVAMIYYDKNKYLSAEIIKNGMGCHYKNIQNLKNYQITRFTQEITK